MAQTVLITGTRAPAAPNCNSDRCSLRRTSRGPMPAVSMSTIFLPRKRSNTRDNSLPLFALCMGAPSIRA